jgi:hypothetical protein
MNCELIGFLLQDILLLIGVKTRSGELVLETGNNIGSIIFHQGKILQAFSPYSRAIGDLLVEEGIISESELLQMLLQQKASDIPIGALFIKTGKISFETIEAMVHQQIREAINEFATWKELRFSFLDKDLKPYDRINLPVNEFIPAETIKSASDFFSLIPRVFPTAAGRS